MSANTIFVKMTCTACNKIAAFSTREAANASRLGFCSIVTEVVLDGEPTQQHDEIEGLAGCS